MVSLADNILVNTDHERMAIFRLIKRLYLLCLPRFIKQGSENGRLCLCRPLEPA